MNGKRRLLIIIGAILGVGVLIAHLAAGGWLLFGNRQDGEIDETLNLLYNSSFEEVGEGNMPEGWIEGKWYWDSGVSTLTLSDEAYSGEKSIMIYSAGENDARFTQTVAAVPNSYYLIRCMVKAEGCSEGRNGAGISIEDTFISSEYVYDTNGEWAELKLYGKTGPEQDYLTIMARIGGYGSLNVGRAWFDDVELYRLKSLPEGVSARSLATNPPSSAKEEEPAEDSEETKVILVALLTAAVMALGLLLMRLNRTASRSAVLLIAALTAGLAARVFFGVTIRGYEVDMNCFMGWSSRMVEHGITGFYNAGWCDYPPGYMLVLYLIGGLRSLLGLTGDTGAAWLLFKSVPILCDMLLAVIIWKLGRRRVGDWKAAILAAMYALNPAAILNSAAWGQVDSVLTILLVLSIYSVVRGRWARGLSIYAAAVLMKPQALMFGPIGLLAVVMELVRSGDRERTEQVKLNPTRGGYKGGPLVGLAIDFWRSRSDKGRAAIKEIGLGIAAMIGIMLLVITPFSLGQGQDPFTWAWNMYGGTLSSYPYITINACNLYSMLGKNWVELENAGWLTQLSWGMYALSFVYAFFLYIKSGKKGNLFLVCAVMLTLVFAFGAKMHERYLYPAMAFLTMAYVVVGDVRLLIALLLVTVGQFVNGALVLINEHLDSAQAIVNNTAAVLNIAGALLTAWTGWDLCVREKVIGLPEKKETLSIAAEEPVRPIVPEDSRLHMRKIDYVIMAAVTLIYSAVAFVNLGAMEAPETAWTSSLAGETVVFDLGERKTFNLTYYGGICNSSFTVSLSEDGEAWSEPQLAVYDQGEIFRWLWFTPAERKDDGDFRKLEGGYPMQTARYVSISAEKAGLILHEVGFLNENGEALPIASVMSYGGDGQRTNNPALLTDEQNTIPPYPSYYNSTYFDEIYHARTAYEHLHGLRPYETTHPPLGKVMIMWGIQLFGMTPFGWRFTGTLLGCLMLPAMYLLAKQLFKKTEYAAIAMLLLSLDCMHFTQTRISTIDTYGVFFIILMYLFMFRYCQMNFFVDDFKKTLIPLGLSGLMMGLGIASKWICIYAAAGLAVLFFYTMIRRYIEYRRAMEQRAGGAAEEKARRNFWKYFVITGAFCVVFFIVIPVLIYYFSYYWYMKPLGGLDVERVWRAQLSMFNYHKGLTGDTHFFQSPWYEWPLIIKPIWFYSGTEFMEEGFVSSISCMGNPAVWWVGAAAMIFVMTRLFSLKGRRTDLYIVLGFAAQYLPWVLVPRSMFIYHYFASVPFIILATVRVYRYLRVRGFKWSRPVMIAVLAAALILFVGFYPLMSGTPVLRSYANYLRWFNWYNF